MNEEILKLTTKEETTKEKITDEMIENFVTECISYYKVIREHTYRDEKGKPIFKVERTSTHNGKSFTISHYEEEKWEPGMKGLKRIPYNLPELIVGVAYNKPVFITQGEKDADTIMELLREKVVATTTLTSSIKKWDYEFNRYLKRNSVIVIVQDDKEDSERFANKTNENIKCTTIKKLSIASLKSYLGITDEEVTDITELREKLNDDVRLKKILMNAI